MPDLWFWATSDGAEHWDGPFDSPEAAAEYGFDSHGDEDIIFVATGEIVDPSRLIDADRILDAISDEPEDCPIHDDWKGYWGTKSADIAELTEAFRTAFREWAAAKKLRDYYTVASHKARAIEREEKA